MRRCCLSDAGRSADQNGSESARSVFARFLETALVRLGPIIRMNQTGVPIVVLINNHDDAPFL